MVSFSRNDARDWAWANMRGCANTIMPSYTHDLRGLNEAGIRHDVRRDIELGFSGALLVSETALSTDEYVEFARIAADEAAGRLQMIFHASFNTLEENIEVGQRVQETGAELALLSYPANFYPSSQRDIYDYSRAFCDSVDMGVILFPVPLWGFERLHPASIDPAVVVELVDDVPNIVAIKAEGGMPAPGGFTHLYHLLADRVIVEHPIEEFAIPLASLVPMQWMGTSYMEYYADAVPRMHSLMTSGKHDEAMEIYWRIDPARKAAAAALVPHGANFIHRHIWKYLGWLQGFNGGPIRHPIMRMNAGQMQALRHALLKSGFDLPDESEGQYYIGRNPA